VLGLLVATVIWVWIAAIDAVVGQPFRTFLLLGGPLIFTAALYALNVAYGIALVTGLHGVDREPSLIIGVAVLSFVVEYVFVMLTIFFSHTGLGTLAWPRILGGNVIGAVATFVFLARRHPLRAMFQAEQREDEAEDGGSGQASDQR
jgi:hypothetical protein